MRIRHDISILIYWPIFLYCLIFGSCQQNPISDRSDRRPVMIKNNEKQRGAHVFASFGGGQDDLESLRERNIEWITLVPWAFQADVDSPNLSHHNGDSLMIKESDDAWLTQINLVRSLGFKVFMKPHIWIHEPTPGKWRSDIHSSTDTDWDQWKDNYRDFVIRYAKLAEKGQVEMFCIGTELSALSVEKPVFWKELITELRSLYSGKISYAANWYKEYEEIQFWHELDYIGIQAYFPLTNTESPSIQDISKGWNQHLDKLNAISKKYNKPILFTELGYKSTTDSAMQPWEWIDQATVGSKRSSLETQVNCYEAFFQTVWPQNWFAGVHLWQIRMGSATDLEDMDFYFVGKPVESNITNYFSKK